MRSHSLNSRQTIMSPPNNHERHESSATFWPCTSPDVLFDSIEGGASLTLLRLSSSTFPLKHVMSLSLFLGPWLSELMRPTQAIAMTTCNNLQEKTGSTQANVRGTKLVGYKNALYYYYYDTTTAVLASNKQKPPPSKIITMDGADGLETWRRFIQLRQCHPNDLLCTASVFATMQHAAVTRRRAAGAHVKSPRKSQRLTGDRSNLPSTLTPNVCSSIRKSVDKKKYMAGTKAV